MAKKKESQEVFEQGEVFDGLHEKMPNGIYRPARGMNYSSLKQLLDMPPAEWRIVQDLPNVPTAPMRKGSAFHTECMEPFLFSKEFTVIPKVDKRTKAGKEKYNKAWARCHASKSIPIDAVDYKIVQDMSKATHAHKKAHKFIQGSVIENSIFWTDPDTGIDCKGRIDLTNDAILGDLKSTQNPSPDAFRSSCNRFRYWTQAAFYMDGYEAVTGIKPKAWLWITVKSVEPYTVAIWSAPAWRIEEGREEYKRCLEILAECKQSGNWPGYDDIVELI